MQNFQPNWCSPPGETISELIADKNLDVDNICRTLNLTAEDYRKLIKGSLKINSHIALGLESIFSVPKEFWLNREHRYRDSLSLQVEECETWLEQLPLSDLVSRGFIEKRLQKPDKVHQCLRFFGVRSIEDWDTAYEGKLSEVAFKTSNSFDSTPLSIATWLRIAELQASEQKVTRFDRKLLESSLVEIRPLTQIKEPARFLPNLKRVLNKCGIKLAVVRGVKSCRASGATFFEDKHAIVVMSFRHLTDDHFWFTLFHELGHLVLHHEGMTFIEGISDSTNHYEQEANKFAMDLLIPPEHQCYLKTLTYKDLRKILKFARKLNISPGIVVGQLQHKNLIPHTHLNKLKTRYKWQ